MINLKQVVARNKQAHVRAGDGDENKNPNVTARAPGLDTDHLRVNLRQKT